MSIKQYSLKADGSRRLAPSFTVREFRCRDGSDVVMIDESLVVLLQCIREHFGKPITITSGYRTAAHNAAVGGGERKMLFRDSFEDGPEDSGRVYAERRVRAPSEPDACTV